MLGLSWAEFLVILVVVLVFIGPKDIPNIAYQMGKVFRRLKYMQFALTNQFEDFMRQAEVKENLDNKRPKIEPDSDPFDEIEGDVDLLEIMPLPQEDDKRKTGKRGVGRES